MSYIFEHEVPRENKVASVKVRWIEKERGQHEKVGAALRDAGYKISDEDCCNHAANIIQNIGCGNADEQHHALRIISNALGRDTVD